MSLFLIIFIWLFVPFVYVLFFVRVFDGWQTIIRRIQFVSLTIIFFELFCFYFFFYSVFFDRFRYKFFCFFFLLRKSVWTRVLQIALKPISKANLTMFCLPFYPSLVDHLSYSIWKKISQIWLIATCHKMQNEYNVCLAHTHTRTDTHAHKSWLLLLFFLKMTLVNWKITWKLLQLALLWNWNCKLDGKSLGHLHFVFVHTHTHTRA